MIRLFLYPELFGLPDNNPYGLKVETFLRLAQIPYRVEHAVNVGSAPRGQLPYLVDGDTVVSDSNRMIEYLSQTYQVDLDDALTSEQRTTNNTFLDYPHAGQPFVLGDVLFALARSKVLANIQIGFPQKFPAGERNGTGCFEKKQHREILVPRYRALRPRTSV